MAASSDCDRCVSSTIPSSAGARPSARRRSSFASRPLRGRGTPGSPFCSVSRRTSRPRERSMAARTEGWRAIASNTVARVNTSAVVGSTAMTEADRRAPSSTASSPITSQLPTLTSSASSPSSEPRTTLSRPSHTTSSVSPGIALIPEVLTPAEAARPGRTRPVARRSSSGRLPNRSVRRRTSIGGRPAPVPVHRTHPSSPIGPMWNDTARRPTMSRPVACVHGPRPCRAHNRPGRPTEAVGTAEVRHASYGCRRDDSRACVRATRPVSSALPSVGQAPQRRTASNP